MIFRISCGFTLPSVSSSPASRNAEIDANDLLGDDLLAGDETVENVETEIDAEDIDVETETEEAADAEETVTE